MPCGGLPPRSLCHCRCQNQHGPQAINKGKHKPPFLTPPFESFKQLNLNIDAYPMVTTSYLVTTTAIVTYMANYVFKPHNTVFCFIFFVSNRVLLCSISPPDHAKFVHFCFRVLFKHSHGFFEAQVSAIGAMVLRGNDNESASIETCECYGGVCRTVTWFAGRVVCRQTVF